MMAAVAYATEFGGGSTTPAYKAKWLYSLASNRNDSALKFSETWPYIEVPDRKRGISEPFKKQLKNFTGIVIDKTRDEDEDGNGYKYTVDFKKKGAKSITLSPDQQFFLAFFVMKLCYTKAAGLIARYKKSEPKPGELTGGFKDKKQEENAEEIEKIFDAFYHGAVAADNEDKKTLPVNTGILQYFRDITNVPPPPNAKEKYTETYVNAYLEKIVGTLDTMLSDNRVIPSTRRMMINMIIDIKSVRGSIEDKRRHARDGSEPTTESQRSGSTKSKEREKSDTSAEASAGNKEPLVPKRKASVSEESNSGSQPVSDPMNEIGNNTTTATNKAKKSSPKEKPVNTETHSYEEQEDESHDTVNIALVGVEDTTKRVLTYLGIIKDGWYENLQENTKAREVGDNIDIAIVRLRTIKERRIKKAIKKYAEWQKKTKKGNRDVIFVDRGSGNVWKAIEGTFGELMPEKSEQYRLFYATLRGKGSDGKVNLYWFSDAHVDVKSASEWISRKLFIKDWIPWKEHGYADSDTYAEDHRDDDDVLGDEPHTPTDDTEEADLSHVEHGTKAKKKEEKVSQEIIVVDSLGSTTESSDLLRYISKVIKDEYREEVGLIKDKDPGNPGDKVDLVFVLLDGVNTKKAKKNIKR
jgi:hypothetical protein